MLNTKGQAVASAHFNRHLAQQAVMDSRTSDAGSDAGHPSHVGQAPHMYQTTSHPLHPMSNVPQMRYQSPSQPLQSMQMLPTSYMQENHPDQSYVNAPPAPASAVGSTGGPVGEAAPKQFHCSTCSKGFARRSDLARHERIHSGIRPHVCDWAGCGKQFIQRSALTVHSRVHTGEKPHMCERCGKVSRPYSKHALTTKLTSSSPLVIPAPLQDIVASTLASVRTSVLTPTARRPSHVALHSRDIRITTPARSRTPQRRRRHSCASRRRGQAVLPMAPILKRARYILHHRHHSALTLCLLAVSSLRSTCIIRSTTTTTQWPTAQ